LLICVGFGTDRKVIQKPNVRGPPKTSRRFGGVFQGRIKGEVNLPLGVGSSEERKKKKRRRKERKKEGKED
jgi:hypothetical protein